MKLKKILNGIQYEILSGKIQTEIKSIKYDSRAIEEGDLFVCIKGYNTDGHKYAKNAANSGALVIICEDDIELIEGVCIIKVNDTREALAVCSSNYYDNPTSKLNIIGVTGTNGKTTTAFMIKAILEEAGFKVGLIGTIANYIGETRIPTVRTTPESLELQKLFRDMVKQGVKYCVMEVSSHSLSLERVYGINFSQGIFTNLTQDHLDFHKTFENYYEAKLMLFHNSKNSIINVDDSYGEKLLKDVKGKKTTYSICGNGDFNADNIVMHSKGIEFDILWDNNKLKINLGIPGKYNVSNALGSAIACINEGIDIEAVRKGLERVFVPGRCEIVTRNYNLDYDIIVDYAHSPDGLENILNTAREFTKGRLIAVFGCGGDRDKTKRPIMGKIGTEISDLAIITSDNPRSEEPIKIIEDILEGIKKGNYIVIENRREAIKKAIHIARKHDVIVIAGKGHETYQILKDKTIHFDEREVIAEIIKELY